MSKPLSEILADGTLVDNTVHRIKDGIFTKGMCGPYLEVRRGGRNQNNAGNVWPFIQKAAVLQFESSRLVFRFPHREYEHNTEELVITHIFLVYLKAF